MIEDEIQFLLHCKQRFSERAKFENIYFFNYNNPNESMKIRLIVN
jgi:hypothetical protein